MIRFKQFLIEQDSKKQKTAKEIATDYITLPDVEGFREKAYEDTGGIWTIGPGITTFSSGKPVKAGDVVSLEQGMQELQHHIDNKVIPNLSKKIPNWNKMSENQKAALISFSYNAGENFYGSKGFETITGALSDQTKWDKVPDALTLYNKGKDQKTGKKIVLPGLVKRRANEGRIWSGTYEGLESSKPLQTTQPSSTEDVVTKTLKTTADVVTKPLEAMGTIFGGTMPIAKTRGIQQQDKIHVVKPGDNLSKIAGGDQKLIDAIAAANEIKDPNKIYPGQKLKIPNR
jgi:GH24 family phage-related lysozyme (muramidase)/LysM repeat protein